MSARANAAIRRDCTPDIGHPCKKQHQPIETEAEARVPDAAPSPELHVPGSMR
jgi:hypothetical protein